MRRRPPQNPRSGRKERQAHSARPIRSCIVCRRRAPQAELLRVGTKKDGTIGIWEPGTAGRSGYVCAAEACIGGISERGRLPRALRRTLEPTEIEAIKRELRCQLR
ncbi:MAG: DUF448 domain-containing protein [Armatimonadetes bacterium]|nr:DUF448 domain-containing protein [Armatimonadota bacterium]